MTIHEFKKAIPDESNCGFVIQVLEHKADFKGPVDISVNSNELYKHLGNYVEHARNCLQGISSNSNAPVFGSFCLVPALSVSFIFCTIFFDVSFV